MSIAAFAALMCSAPGFTALSRQPTTDSYMAAALSGANAALFSLAADVGTADEPPRLVSGIPTSFGGAAVAAALSGANAAIDMLAASPPGTSLPRLTESRYFVSGRRRLSMHRRLSQSRLGSDARAFLRSRRRVFAITRSRAL